MSLIWVGLVGNCRQVTIVTNGSLRSGCATVQILATSAQNHLQLSLNVYLSQGQKSVWRYKGKNRMFIIQALQLVMNVKFMTLSIWSKWVVNYIYFFKSSRNASWGIKNYEKVIIQHSKSLAWIKLNCLGGKMPGQHAFQKREEQCWNGWENCAFAFVFAFAWG